MLDLQSELAATVAREIAVQLTPAEEKQLAGRGARPSGSASRIPEEPARVQVATREGVEIGVRHAREALALDPSYAPAWAALADALMIGTVRGSLVPAEHPGGERPPHGVPWSSTPCWGKLMPPSAPSAASAAIFSEVSSPGARPRAEVEQCMVYIVLGRALYALERHEEALAMATIAVRLDPMSALDRTALGDAYYFAREHEKSHFPLPDGHGARSPLRWSAHRPRARLRDAGPLRRGARGLRGGASRRRRSRRAIVWSRPSGSLGGDEAEAQADSGRADRGPSLARRVGMGDRCGACPVGRYQTRRLSGWIRLQGACAGTILLRVHPRFDSIRGDARYQPMIERIGLKGTATEVTNR